MGFSTNQLLTFGSVTKIWDIFIGVTTVTLSSEVGDSQMVKSRKENKQSYDDDRDSAVRMLKHKNDSCENELQADMSSSS